VEISTEYVPTDNAIAADVTPIDPEPGSADAGRRRGVIVLPLVALGAVVALAVALYSGLLDRVPLLSQSAAIAIECLGAAALVASWLSAGRRWLRRTLPIMLGGVVVVTVLIAVVLWQTGTVTDAYPPTFGIWVGTAFLALAGVPVGLRVRWSPARVTTADRVRRSTAVLAVPLTALGALMLIDGEYGIWPEVSDLLGHTQTLHADALPVVAAPDPVRPSKGAPAPVDVPMPKQGVVVDIDPPATVSHFHHRPGLVYLPPAYLRSGAANLPVLIMLIGTPGAPINWIRAGHAQATGDAYAAAHHGVAPILVVIDQNGSTTGDTECVDGPQGNAETYLTVDVPTFLATKLHVTSDPARWGVVGFSEGGTCAIDLFVSHTDLFHHAVDLGGDLRPTLGGSQHTLTALFGGSVAAQQAHDPLLVMASRRYTGVSAWFAGGTQDSYAITAAQRLSGAAEKAGITQHQLTLTGGHSWQFAAAAFTQILPALCVDLGCDGAPAGSARSGAARS
jgi:S-formylglutathione hydrolase FrmB